MYIGAKSTGMGQLDPMPKNPLTNPSQPLTAGGASTFNSVAGGIASILSPIVNAGVSIYLTKEQLAAQERLAKLQQLQTPQVVYAPAQQNSQNTILIAAIVGAALLLLIFMIGKKSTDSISGMAVPPGKTVTKVVRRIKKPK